MKNTFRALAGRDFRLYFSGQIVSLIGTWVQQVAMSWIAYRITGSPFMLGLIAFSGQIPMLLATPLGGVLADKFHKRNILLYVEIAELLLAIVLTVIAWQQAFEPWILISASVLLGLFAAIELPSRQAFITEIIHDRSVMSNAIALNSLTFNTARLFGPAVAGVILAVFNEPACFAVNVLSYAASIFTLLSIKPKAVAKTRVAGTFAEALVYLRQFDPAFWLVITVAVTSLCISPFMTFMPFYAKDVFDGGPDLLGTLLGASGAGTLIAALYLANRKSVLGLGNTIVLGCIMNGIAAVGFSYNTLQTLALPLLVMSGAAFIITVTSCNILLQSLVKEHLRARVMAIYTMSFVGMLPVGSLVYGGLAHIIGVQPVFVIAGVIALVFSYLLWRLLPDLRSQGLPVLSSNGII
ncbi:MAG TPA: MFS transporter [Methylophilaceae bacterium]